MEAASMFVVNKADRSGADKFASLLKAMLHASGDLRYNNQSVVLKTIASKGEGIAELKLAVDQLLLKDRNTERKIALLARRAYRLIEKKRMVDVSSADLFEQIKKELESNRFKLYNFIKNYN